MEECDTEVDRIKQKSSSYSSARQYSSLVADGGLTRFVEQVERGHTNHKEAREITSYLMSAALRPHDSIRHRYSKGPQNCSGHNASGL